MKQKGFIQIPLLIIAVASITALSVGAGVVLYAQQKTPSFTANIGEAIYNAIYEKDFEIEKLKQEAESSRIEEKRAKGQAQEELIKRTEAEKIAEEETIKRTQEELEKRIAEEKLSEKEAEEQRLSADIDKDGLTLREEQKSGTSDLDVDSDDDGIIDSKDTHPAGGGQNIPKKFPWNYVGHNWTWTESIQEDWYDYYKAKQPRPDPKSVEYVTYDDPFIQSIAKVISEAAEKDNLGESALAKSFVQSLSYVDDIYTGYDEYPKYPIETFFEKNGDCEDTSYLAAAIIRAMNISTVLVVLPGHMAVGIWIDCDEPGTSYKIDDRCYYYIETSGEGWPIGEIPDEYKYSKATIIKIPSGETIDNVSPRYNKPCYTSKEFPNYYYDGADYYSNSQCTHLTHCLRYKEYYYNYKTESLYWDSSCFQIIVEGCYKSKSYSGKFYISGIAWYYDSKCTQTYKSMACTYPSYYNYSCWSETGYSSKQSTCALYARLGYSQETIDNCYQELAQCRNDINEYQRKYNEYSQCFDRKEY